MSAPIMYGVYALRIAVVCCTEEFSEALLALGNCNQVDMVRHETIRQYGHIRDTL